MNAGSVLVRFEVNLYGALEDGRINIVKRTLALWCIGAAQWLLKSRIECSFSSEDRS